MSGDRRPRWASLSDEERERQYSPSSVLDGPLGPWLDGYRRHSREAYEAVADRGAVLTVEYGPLRINTADLALPEEARPSPGAGSGHSPGSPSPGSPSPGSPSPGAPSPGSPLHIFIHGGYWQQLSKRESFFAAPASLAAGMGFAAVDYTLAPRATLDQIVSECRRAIVWLTEFARSTRSLDPDRVVVSGSSAGAHLAAMATWQLPPENRPSALVLLSGIYELEPLIGTSINDAVGLDVDTARRNSPLRRDVSGFPPTVVAVGEIEPDEFKRQSRAFADRLTAAGVEVAEIEVAGRNHFDLVYDIVPTLIDRIPTGLRDGGHA